MIRADRLDARQQSRVRCVRPRTAMLAGASAGPSQAPMLAAPERPAPPDPTSEDIGRALAPLRAGTRELHERLEARLPPRSIVESRDRYRAVLARMFGVYGRLEPRIEHQLGAAWPALDLLARRKAPLLHGDLLELGLTGSAIDALPRCPAAPAPASADEALGCLYVLEGATLGGKIILRSATALGVDGERGGRFFGAYGPQVGRRWRDFAAVVADATAAGADVATMVASARATFAALEAWLCD
jgi:heme oxygenase